MTRSVPGVIVTTLLGSAGLVPNEDPAQELKLSRIQKDNNDIPCIIKEIADTLNPFAVSDDHLYCLTTGKAASDDVRNDLLQVVEMGTLWHEEFLSQCKESPKRFCASNVEKSGTLLMMP